MSTSFLACTVRGCGLPLTRIDRRFVCPRSHSYDVARSGYLNLLQPQDRRSRHAGDSKAAVEARARLLVDGVGRAILDEFVRRAAALDFTAPGVVIELGSGSGNALGALAAVRPIDGVGIDLSTAAADHAARRFPTLTWIVANADRHLPLLDRSAHLILSLHARRNPAECARVLAPGGFLLVAVPAEDDLIELREVVQGKRLERERASSVIAEHEPVFAFVDRADARERHHLAREPLMDLLRGTYRGERTSVATRVETLASLDVTLSSTFLLFTPG